MISNIKTTQNREIFCLVIFTEENFSEIKILKKDIDLSRFIVYIYLQGSKSELCREINMQCRKAPIFHRNEKTIEPNGSKIIVPDRVRFGSSKLGITALHFYQNDNTDNTLLVRDCLSLRP